MGLWQLILTAFVSTIGYVLPRGAGVLLAIRGPIVAFSAPIGVLAVVGHALFGAGLAWIGYALWAEREPAKG